MADDKVFRLLTIAGSDSGGGAGIQADLKTFEAHSCFGMSVITALTAQNTREVRAIHDVPAAFVRAQLEAVFEDIGTDAVKIGMLFSPSIIKTVAETLKRNATGPIVLDPVMVSKSGNRLLQEEAITVLKETLLPFVTLVTPNIPEAEILSGMSLAKVRDWEAAARVLENLCPNVLIKGGHSTEADVPNFLLSDSTVHWIHTPRVNTRNTHGTGCTLSSAIAARLAQGYGLHEAVRLSIEYLTGAIQAAQKERLGSGHGPVKHSY